MKKLLSLLIFIIVITSSFGTATFSENNNSSPKQIMIELSFSQPDFKEKDNYLKIDIRETNSYLIKQNQPLLPSYLETYYFPIGTKIINVDCTPLKIQQQFLTKKIIPSPQPVLIDSEIIIEDKLMSYSDNPYPADWFEYDVGLGLNDDNELSVILKVQAYPVKYYNSINMVDIASDFEIIIEYEELNQEILTFNDVYDFIILSPIEYTNSLNDLVEHKNNRNISTKLITLNEIYNGNFFPVQGRDNPEKIKYFIKNAIESWGINFVLLVGGSQNFPVRETHVKANSDDSEIFVSDLYYADIYNETYQFSSWDSNQNDVFGEYNWGSSRLYDDVDLYPDVYIGRLACVDYNEVITSVNKIITYESNEAYTSDWFSKIVVVGGDSFPGDEDELSEGEFVNEAVIEIMDGFIPERLWASNDRLSGVSPTGVSEITQVINEGCGFIDFSGHGNTAVWATHPYENEDMWLPTPAGNYRNNHVKDLANQDKLPIVVTGACSVGKYNRDDDCYSWSFVSNPNGGAIGSFGATGLGWAYTGNWVTYGLIEKMSLNIFEAYKDQNAITFGELWAKAISNYISVGMEGTDYKTIEEWQSFGDPTLSIASESLAPEKPQVPAGPTSGKINVEHMYNTSTLDPDGDDIFYLFDWGNGEYSGWIGPFESGEIAQASYIWTEKGDYQIRVKAKDEHGSMSDWSDPLPISMPKNMEIIKQNLLDIFENFTLLYLKLKLIKDL